MKLYNQIFKLWSKRNGVSLYVMLLPAALVAQELRIGQGASLVVQGDAKIVLNDVSFVSNGNFVAGNGTVLFTGNAERKATVIGGQSLTTFFNVSVNKPFSLVQLNNDIFIGGLLTMSAGNLELNNRRLDLGGSGNIAGEQLNARITGANGGVVVRTAILNAPASVNPGNIGVELSSPANLGYTVITRGHVQQTNAYGHKSIARYYEIKPAFQTADVTLRFHYLEAELEGNKEADLVLWSDGGIRGWASLGIENSNISTNWIEKNKVGGLRFTLGVSEPDMAARSVKRAGAPAATLMQVFPNPTADRFVVSFYNEAGKEGAVSLQDQWGRVLERRQLQYIKGMNTLQWNIAKYPAGTYYVVFERGQVVKVVKQ